MKSLADTLELAQKRGHEALYVQVTGNCYIQVARNDLAERVYTENADLMMMLDDDVEWRPEDCLKLCEMKDDVVAGIYRLKTVDKATMTPRPDIEEYPVTIPVGADDRPIVRSDGCILGGFVPTGFLKVSRTALDKLREGYPERKYKNFKDGELENEIYDLFPQGIRDGRWWGEDYAFCHLWKKLGGLIWIVPNITFTHWRGTLPYTGNYHEFLLRQPGGSKHVSEDNVCSERMVG